MRFFSYSNIGGLFSSGNSSAERLCKKFVHSGSAFCRFGGGLALFLIALRSSRLDLAHSSFTSSKQALDKVDILNYVKAAFSGHSTQLTAQKSQLDERVHAAFLLFLSERGTLLKIRSGRVEPAVIEHTTVRVPVVFCDKRTVNYRFVQTDSVSQGTIYGYCIVRVE